MKVSYGIVNNKAQPDLEMKWFTSSKGEEDALVGKFSSDIVSKFLLSRASNASLFPRF
jgi:hypothetical protein